MIKSNFSKNNNNINKINNNNYNNNSNLYMEKNFSNENLPILNTINNTGNNSNNNSFQNIQINKGNNSNYLNSQFQDLEAHEEENFKQIDLLMRKIMSD